MKYSIFLFALLFMILSCDDDKEKRNLKVSKDKIVESIESINKENIEIEDRQIEDYLKRRNWEFESTKTGLRYKIYEQGYGIAPKKGDVVVFDYSLSLIRGEKIYNSNDDGKKVFRIGKGDEISGLHEAALLFKTGAKAKLIVPSYLAYGVTGDDNKIPMNATLIYDLHLTEIR